MDLLGFDRESIIYSNELNLSILEYNDTHGFTPEILKNKKNVISIYQNSVSQDKKELVLEYICRVQDLYYIYLTLDSTIKTEPSDNYKMRIYYNFKDRQQINLLLTSLKK